MEDIENRLFACGFVYKPEYEVAGTTEFYRTYELVLGKYICWVDVSSRLEMQSTLKDTSRDCYIIASRQYETIETLLEQTFKKMVWN